MEIPEENNSAPPRMLNSSLLASNMTQVSIPSSRLLEYIRLILMVPFIVGIGFFIYFLTMILTVFLKTPHIQDNARYVLFVSMLVNDIFFLLLGFYLMIASIYDFQAPGPLCYLMYFLSAISFSITPYTLAAMAIEQYVAICQPLRHAEICTAYRAHVTFTIIGFFSATPFVVELCLILASRTNILNLYIICRQKFMIVNPIQVILRSINLILCFTLVGLVILITYVKIMLVAHRVSSRSSLASKAGRTVMSHAFHLLLCMASLLSRLTETLEIKQFDLMPIINFLIFTYLPRFLGPVIYGIRDNSLREHMKFSLSNFLGKNKGQVCRLSEGFYRTHLV